MLRVIGFGDNVVDDYVHQSTYYPGGNALNFSVYAKMLGQQAAYCGILGDDEAGQHIFSVLYDLGIELSRIRVVHGENGRAKVEIRNGDRVFIGSNKGGIAKETPFDFNTIDALYMRGFDIIHTSCFSYIDHLLPLLSQHNKNISYDFSVNFTKEHLTSVCPYIHIAELSCSHLVDDEIQNIIYSIHEVGCPVIITTMGMRGTIVSLAGKQYFTKSFDVPVVDSMGAGDALITSFLIDLYSLYKEKEVYERTDDHVGLREYNEWFDVQIQIRLASAVLFATRICMKHGAFGYGYHY